MDRQKCSPSAPLVKVTSSAYRGPGIELRLRSVVIVPLAKGFPLNITSYGGAFFPPDILTVFGEGKKISFNVRSMVGSIPWEKL